MIEISKDAMNVELVDYFQQTLINNIFAKCLGIKINDIVNEINLLYNLLY